MLRSEKRSKSIKPKPKQNLPTLKTMWSNFPHNDYIKKEINKRKNLQWYNVTEVGNQTDDRI